MTLVGTGDDSLKSAAFVQVFEVFEFEATWSASGILHSQDAYCWLDYLEQ
jgi:hypothetical protein